MFETETAAVRAQGRRRHLPDPGGSHVEKAGSATNSGRALQWRYQAAQPAGNSKDDNELLLRFAKALDTAGAFAHIKAVWDANGIDLRARPASCTRSSTASRTVATYWHRLRLSTRCRRRSKLVNVRKIVDATRSPYDSDAVTASRVPSGSPRRSTASTTASVGGGGTIWIYTEALQRRTQRADDGRHRAAASPADYASVERRRTARRAATVSDPAGSSCFHEWGYSWLVNRRVFYNNSEVPDDQTTTSSWVRTPVARLFALNATPALASTTRAGTARTTRWSDKPSPIVAGDTHRARTTCGTGRPTITLRRHASRPHRALRDSAPGSRLRRSQHGGRNTKRTAQRGTSSRPTRRSPDATSRRDAGRLPARAHHHPVRRALPGWPDHPQQLVERRARAGAVDRDQLGRRRAACGIKDGDWVNVVTARGDSTARPASTTERCATGVRRKGFKARVGVGLADQPACRRRASWPFRGTGVTGPVDRLPRERPVHRRDGCEHDDS